jgi:23S rRNA (adenine1618-N6)-methyltransferase
MQPAYPVSMHPRNRHQDRYDLQALAKALPELSPFITINEFNVETIDFSNSVAVKALNKALLKAFYGFSFWDIPANYLCPPIPGRADYIHTVSDLFAEKKNLRVLDIGTGANAIYPLIGSNEYNWSFVGSDVDPKALQNAEKIISANQLQKQITFRLQNDPKAIFRSIIQEQEFFDLTICNPPFHESLEEASRGTSRKWKNLGKKVNKTELNFGGQKAELWCPGGERAFILNMMKESKTFASQVRYFTTLVSKEANLLPLTKFLKDMKTPIIQTLDMTQGQKKSRILCWSFQLSPRTTQSVIL